MNCWTIRNWKQAEQVRPLGVDGLIADFPSVNRFGEVRDLGWANEGSE